LLAERNNAGKTEHVGVFTKDIPNACTDGKNVMFNPDWYFALTLPERVYVAGHEVVHNVYGDVEFLHQCVNSGKVPQSDGTTIPFDNMTMQKSMDFRINALLDQSKIGIAPKEGNFDASTTANDALLEVYRRNWKKQPDGQGGGGGTDPGGFDSVLPPGKSTGQNPNQAAAQRNAQQWGVELAAARKLDQIRHQGRSPGALERMYTDILEPEIPWIEQIKTTFARKIGSGGKTWKLPDRRYMVHGLYLPRSTGFGAGHIVVYGDTSGSIGNEEIAAYIAELGGILEDVKPKRLTVLWTDTRIAKVDEIEDISDLQNLKPLGGGGSDSRPCFKWIEDLDETPECFVGFTDGAISFPAHEPKCEVIWASVTDCSYPFGDVVRIRK
jgi:predicted metal-dependent peptidase